MSDPTPSSKEPREATEHEVPHYAVVKCACGAEPSDAVDNDEACRWLIDHIHDSCVDHDWKVKYTGYEGARVTLECGKCGQPGHAANVLPLKVFPDG